MRRLLFYIALLVATGFPAPGADDKAQANAPVSAQPSTTPTPNASQSAQPNAQATTPDTAQSNAPQTEQPNVVRDFIGAGTTTTEFFKTQSAWEVRWNATRVVSVAVMAPDGTILAGGAGVLRGSLFLPMGGRFYLKVTDDSATAASPDSAAAPPATPDAGASSQPTWQLRVVELGTKTPPDQTLTVLTPFFAPPDSAILPPPVTPKLTDEQTRSALVVKGDNAEGSGFLVKTPDGTFVMTSLHLLAANPNVKILTSSGTPINPVSLKGATDCDIAMFAVKDAHYSYLPLAASVADTAKIGDRVVIPGINDGNTEVFSMPAKIINISPDRVDFNNRLIPSSSGAPLVHADSGKVLGVVTAVKRPDLSDAIFNAWPDNPVPGTAWMTPYTSLRVDNIHGWENYDQTRLLNETTFLQEFHRDTRYLDSFLNGKKRRSTAPPAHPDEGVPDNLYFLAYDKLRQAVDNYKQIANSGVPDQEQRNSAARVLFSDLENIVDIGMTTLTDASSFYSFDQIRAKEEIAYRQAIKKELDGLGGNIAQLDSLARTR